MQAALRGQISLATAQLLDGSRDQGLQAGYQAVEQAAALHSARTFTKLARLADVAQRYFNNDPDAVDLRRRIAALAPPDPPAQSRRTGTSRPTPTG